MSGLHSNTVNIFIVEDEWLIRKELVALIDTFRDANVIGQASNINDALSQINKLHPDVLILDIHLHGSTCFDLIEKLPQKYPVIFISAYDQYKAECQRFEAVDYLLKPITLEKLKSALLKIEG